MQILSFFLVNCTILHIKHNFHMNLRHISAVVVIFQLLNQFCNFFSFAHVILNVTFFLFFSRTQTLLLENYCLNITILNKYEKIMICNGLTYDINRSQWNKIQCIWEALHGQLECYGCIASQPMGLFLCHITFTTIPNQWHS